MEAIKVNLIPNGIPEACHASQYDEGRQIRLDLFDGLTPYTIQAGDTFTLNVRKPDNHVITETVTGTEGDTYLVIETSEQMTAVTGENLCEIRLENDGDNIGSLNFIMQVERDVIANGIPSESVIEDLEALVVEAVGDNYYTKTETDALIENAKNNTRIIDEASGAIARFNTDLTENLLLAVAEFSASQASGTPTPSAPIPIVGVDKVNVVCCGKNLCNLFKDGKVPSIVDGSLVNAATGGRTDYIKALPNTYYTFSTGALIANLYMFFYDENKNYISYTGTNTTSVSYQTPANCGFIMLRTSSNPVDVVEPQLEVGSTATDYEPYNGTTALINLGGTYYGGEVDAVTGKITLTHGLFEFDGSNDENWDKYTVNTDQTMWRTSIPERKRGELAQTGDISSICNRFERALNTTGGRIQGKYSGALNYFDVIYNDASDLTTWRTWLANNPIQLAVELETPIVVYASNTAEIPTLNGDNQVFADSGNIAVKYKKSVKAYIDDKLKAIFVSYDNSNSGLTATNTQDAIDELAGANRSVNTLRTGAISTDIEVREPVEPDSEPVELEGEVTEQPENEGNDNEER